MNKTLRSLGIEDAFDEEKANFSAMSAQSSGLYVSKVVNKAYNKTSKKGTEDAAVTGIKEVECCLNEPIDLTVYHSFLFTIFT